MRYNKIIIMIYNKRRRLKRLYILHTYGNSIENSKGKELKAQKMLR